MEQPKELRTFKQIKDTPDVKKGALWQEQYEGGTQPYEMINKEFYLGHGSPFTYATRSIIEDAPDWFVEVFKVHPEYMTKEKLEQWEAFKARRTERKVSTPKKTSKRIFADRNLKYGWLYNMEIGNVKIINAKDRDNTVQAGYTHGKKFGKRFSFYRISDTGVRVTRVE